MHGALTHEVLACAYEVHTVLGPGLLESAYRACMERELRLRDLAYEAECPMPIRYKGEALDRGYRADLIIEGKVIVELKAVDKLLPIHYTQLFTYLRLTGLHVGLLINFNVSSLRNGIKRVVHKARPEAALLPSTP